MMRLIAWLKRLVSSERTRRFALIVLIAVALLSSSGVINFQPHLASSSTILPGKSLLISSENAYPGTTDWLIPGTTTYSTQIQAYAGATSVSPKQTLTFYVSTQVPNIPYEVKIYRLGWYGGRGGRLMEQSQHIGQAQGYYDSSLKKLIGCLSCYQDPKTHLIEANWQPSFTLTIPSSWVTGVYEATFADADGIQAAVHFVVRGNPSAAYIVAIADNTTAAYNNWGGYSLYTGPDGKSQSHATKVSFDRPVPNWSQIGGKGLSYEIDAIRWMERNGYDLSYISSVDLDEHPEQLLKHRAYISLGHDEYWSKAMRDGVENARNHGVGLAFFGANDIYWQIRYEPDSHGNPDRTIVCYRIAKLDPLFGKDNAVVTVRWRDPPVNRPENALIGIMYQSWVGLPEGYAWHMSPTASSPFLRGTGLKPGQSYGCNLVGYEWDTLYQNGATPPGLVVLGISPVISYSHHKGTSYTTYYIAPSGALVFASGSIYWAYALDDLRVWNGFSTTQEWQEYPCLKQSRAIPGIQKLMEHIMSALLTRHQTGLAQVQSQPVP